MHSLIKLGSLTVLTFTIVQASAHAAPLQIVVLDARNGHPVKKQKVSLAVKGEKWAREYATDAQGKISLDLDPSAQIVPTTEWWVTCRAINPAQPHWFSIGAILENGAADENNCGKARREAAPGKLIIFARPASLGQLFAK